MKTVAVREAGAPIFAALGDEVRLRIVTKLSSAGPQSITRLTAGQRVTRQAIAKHLGVLAGTGLVANERRGRQQIYQLRSAPLDDARRCLDILAKQWDAALARLAAFVEE